MRHGAIALILGALWWAPEARGQEVTYRVDSDESRFTVHVGKAGLFKIFGHDHDVEARSFTGTVAWNEEAPQRSRFVLEVDASSLTVVDEDLSEEDRAQVQADMESKALALSEYPEIRFVSSEVNVEDAREGTYRLEIKGTLALRGVRRELELPVRLAIGDERLTAMGKLELESDRWGVPQISAAAGTVKTSKELDLSYEIVATREK